MALSGRPAPLVKDAPDCQLNWEWLYTRLAQTPMLHSQVDTPVNNATGGYLLLAGPSLTAPVAGDYIVDFGTSVYASAGGFVAFTGLFVNGALNKQIQSNFAAFNEIFTIMQRRAITLAQGDVVDVRCLNFPAGTGNWQDRWVSITPRST